MGEMSHTRFKPSPKGDYLVSWFGGKCAVVSADQNASVNIGLKTLYPEVYLNYLSCIPENPFDLQGLNTVLSDKTRVVLTQVGEARYELRPYTRSNVGASAPQDFQKYMREGNYWTPSVIYWTQVKNLLHAKLGLPLEEREKRKAEQKT
jgi:hypothetical protein